MLNIKESFTSADSIPIKLICNPSLISEIVRKGRIPPYHVQLIPTNRCNMACPFCSCSGDDRKTELPFSSLVNLVSDLVSEGAKAVTITGGGEPTLYPKFNDMLSLFNHNSIAMGLVSNGLLLHRQDFAKLNLLTWCRISNGDFRTFTPSYAESLYEVVKECPKVDWAFSHVVSSTPNFDEIERVIDFANAANFTHVRLVADLYEPQSVPMALVKDTLSFRGVDTSRVIFQDRAYPVKGGDCRIGYLKPLISAEGFIYMCCGVQYAIEGKTRKMPMELCMGEISDFKKAMSDTSSIAKGRQCDKCYYSGYNKILGLLVKHVGHKDFL